jgi:hypothetical protein
LARTPKELASWLKRISEMANGELCVATTALSLVRPEQHFSPQSRLHTHSYMTARRNITTESGHLGRYKE